MYTECSQDLNAPHLKKLSHIELSDALFSFISLTVFWFPEYTCGLSSASDRERKETERPESDGRVGELQASERMRGGVEERTRERSMIYTF